MGSVGCHKGGSKATLSRIGVFPHYSEVPLSGRLRAPQELDPGPEVAMLGILQRLFDLAVGGPAG